MSNQIVKHATVVTGLTAAPTNQQQELIALWNADGSAFTPDDTGMVPAATQATFAGADITALKVELNAFLTKLKAAGIVLP